MSSKPRKRSRLFQAKPGALLVEEWVPNITLPPPPQTPLEDDGQEALLDEHGLPEPLDEEPEEERRGPARIYVGEGTRSPAPAPAPVADVAMPDLALPKGDLDDDEEEDSLGELPDLSIDGSGQSWQEGAPLAEELDHERPTDPGLHSPGSDPGLEQEQPEAPTDDAPPLLSTTPSWTPPAPEPPARRDTGKPLGSETPPRVRPFKPPPPGPRTDEPLQTFLPRSLIIALVVLLLLVILVWFLRKQQDPDLDLGAGARPGTTEAAAPAPAGPPGPPPEHPPSEPEVEEAFSIQPTSPEPAAEPEPAAAEPEPAAVEPAPAVLPPPTEPSSGSGITGRRERSASPPTPAASTARSPSASSARAPAPAPSPPPAVEEPLVSDGDGFLVVESDRYAMVYMGGRRLGGTPIASMELEPGSYAVRAVCRDTGATQTKQVEIKAGDTATASFRFSP